MLDPEQFTAAIAPVSWPDTLVAGERHGIQARITVNGQPVAGAAVRWSVADPSVLQVDTTTSADSIDVRGLRPGTSRVTASIADPALTQQSVSADVTVRLAGVRIVAPVDDTTLTALGDTLVVAAEGLGQSDVAVDGAGVTFTVEGTALRRISAALDRVEVVAAGTGTGRVIATHSLCSGACVDTVSVTVIQVPASVDVSGAVDSLAAGDTTTFSATVRDANGAAIPGPAVTWSSSDTAVAVVSAAGVVTGAAPGNATITAAAGSATGTRDITVTTLVVADAAVAPDSLRFASLQDTARLAATAYNGQGNVIPGVTFAWSSADTTVATVDAGGLVRSVGNGTTVVIAAGPGDAGGVADSATVVVDQVVASVTLTPASVTLHSKVDSVQLAAVAKDARGNDVASATVEYSRLHSTVTVNSSGLVISQAVGADTVVASVNGMADSTAITVEQVVKT
ncbi:MAG TPA: Ig-like domain-containing protein, partial [Longimicrobiales bacterium]|nr:Ig-like domain-containing protein [Longimicrobiales bacterium]